VTNALRAGNRPGTIFHLRFAAQMDLRRHDRDLLAEMTGGERPATKARTDTTKRAAHPERGRTAAPDGSPFFFGP